MGKQRKNSAPLPTKDAYRKVVNLMRAGHDVEFVSAATGVSESTILKRWEVWDKKFRTQEDSRRRAVHLKAQGWTTDNVADETGLKANTINQCWRSWAKEFGMKVPEKLLRGLHSNGEVVTRFLHSEQDADGKNESDFEIMVVKIDRNRGDRGV